MKNIKSIAAGLYLGISAIGFAAAPAHAVLLSVADVTGAFGGADVVTFDDVNNVEWLDLTQSTGRSFGDVAGEFGAGGDFAGWRHATAFELSILFTEGNFGFPAPFNLSDSEDAAFVGTHISEVGFFAGMLGATVDVPQAGTNSSFFHAIGYYDDLDALDPLVGLGSVGFDGGVGLSVNIHAYFDPNSTLASSCP